MESSHSIRVSHDLFVFLQFIRNHYGLRGMNEALIFIIAGGIKPLEDE